MKPVSIDEILGHPKALVDYYLQLSEAKFVHLFKVGAAVSAEQLIKYKHKKNILYLFVREEDFSKYLASTLTVAGVRFGGPKPPADLTKLSIIERAMHSVYSDVQLAGFNKEALDQTQMVHQAVMNLVNSQFDLNQLIDKIQKLPEDHARHSVMVSMFAPLIGLAMGWEKPGTLEKLALGGLLHDIGKTKLPGDIATKPVDRLAHDEKIIYRSHAEAGYLALLQVKVLPDDVLQIVYQHHEAADGSGFPQGLKDMTTHPLARVVILANAYVDSIFADGGTIGRHTAQRAFEELSLNKHHLFNRDCMKALAKVFSEAKWVAAG